MGIIGNLKGSSHSLETKLEKENDILFCSFRNIDDEIGIIQIFYKVSQKSQYKFIRWPHILIERPSLRNTVMQKRDCKVDLKSAAHAQHRTICCIIENKTNMKCCKERIVSGRQSPPPWSMNNKTWAEWIVQ